MTDEQQRELPGAETASQPAPVETPTIIQTLIFPRYVVVEVYRRVEQKLGLKALRNDDDIAWAVQRRPSTHSDRIADAPWDVGKGNSLADPVATFADHSSREA